MTLRVLSWNVCGAALSQAAPPDFRLEDKCRHIADSIAQTRPDLVSLQELSDPVLDQLLAALPGFGVLAATESHNGMTVLLLRKAAPLQAEGRLILPGIAAARLVPVTSSGASAPLYVAACHLLPSEQNAARRLQQLRALLAALPPAAGAPAADLGSAALVVFGDTNMRESETEAVLALASGLRDAFLEAGGEGAGALEHTWDSGANRFHGPQARRYTARYDRILHRHLAAQDFQLVGAVPEPEGFYLSDHFGVACALNLEAPKLGCADAPAPLAAPLPAPLPASGVICTVEVVSARCGAKQPQTNTFSFRVQA